MRAADPSITSGDAGFCSIWRPTISDLQCEGLPAGGRNQDVISSESARIRFQAATPVTPTAARLGAGVVNPCRTPREIASRCRPSHTHCSRRRQRRAYTRFSRANLLVQRRFVRCFVIARRGQNFPVGCWQRRTFIRRRRPLSSPSATADTDGRFVPEQGWWDRKTVIAGGRLIIAINPNSNIRHFRTAPIAKKRILPTQTNLSARDYHKESFRELRNEVRHRSHFAD